VLGQQFGASPPPLVLDVAVVAGGEQVEADVVQPGARGTAVAEHGATDRGEVLDRITGAVVERDQLAVRTPSRRRAR
jgi:hypothetical protein